METIKILWGVKIGDEAWKEQILTTNAGQIEAAKKWAAKNGFHLFRVSTDDGSPPDFAGTIAKRQKRGKQ